MRFLAFNRSWQFMDSQIADAGSLPLPLPVAQTRVENVPLFDRRTTGVYNCELQRPSSGGAVIISLHEDANSNHAASMFGRGAKATNH